MLNPDFAIILNFNLTNPENTNTDSLVKRARDIGARAVSSNHPELFEKACDKYTIKNLEEKTGQEYSTENVIEELINKRKNGDALIINLTVNDSISDDDQKTLEVINTFMHKFGHVINEGKPSSLSADAPDSFILENRHVAYQKYVFLRKPLPESVAITGLNEEPNRVEWIADRTECPFSYEDNKLYLDLTSENELDLPWQVIRIQCHRPEDDIESTQF